MKNGYALGKRRWKCRFCRYEYTQQIFHGELNALKKQVILLYENGWSSNTISQLLHVSPASVLRWARQHTWPQGRVYHIKPRIYLPLEVKLVLKDLQQIKQEFRQWRN